MAMATKKTRGRQRIEIAKMQNEDRLNVTFSKRKNGLFKKANELCTLTGAEVAITVFSPAKRPFSFGSANLETIIGRLQTQSPQSFSYADILLQSYRRFRLESLNNIHEHIEKELKTAKMLREMLNIQSQNWWEAPIQELSFEQLQELKLTVQILRERIPNETGVVVSEENLTDFPFPHYLMNNVYDIDDLLFDFSSSGNFGCFDVPTNFEAPGTFNLSEYVAGPTGLEGSQWISWAGNSSAGADFNQMASGAGGPEMPHPSAADFIPTASGVGAPEMPHASVHGYRPAFF